MIERLGHSVAEPESHPDDTGFSLRQGIEQRLELLLQHGETHCIRGYDRLGVFDEVAEFAVTVFAQRSVEGDRLAAVLLHLDDLLGSHVELAAQFFRSRFAAEILQHLPLHPGKLVDDLDHVHRNANGAGLIGHGTCYRLADPPGGVGRKLEPLGVVELLDGPDEAEIALLNEIQELHTAAGIALRQRNHETEVGPEKMALRTLPIASNPRQLASLGGALLSGCQLGEFVLGEQPRFDSHRELDFFGRIEKRDFTDLLEVILDRVGRGSGDGRRINGHVIVIIDE